MSVGATTSFEESRDDIIREALENLGAIAPNESRSSNNGDLFEAGNKALNRVVKAIDATGQRLWKIVRRTTTTTAGTASFSLASDVLNVDEPMRYTRDGETARAGVLKPMTRDEYMELSDRTTPGTPRQFYVERTITAKTVYLYPVPDATDDTIEYAVAVRQADFVTGADTPDFPAEWTNALVYALTAELAPKFQQMAVMAQFKALAEGELARLVNQDNEKGPMVLVAWGGNYSCGAG